MAKYAIEMYGITKRFQGFYANNDVDLLVEQGEIHSILGENGAGKTTLMNILFGLYKADAGIIKIKGTEVKINSPLDAFSHGVGMVHQHFMLIERLTVLENIILGSEIGGIRLDKKANRRAVEQAMKSYYFNLPLDQPVHTLSVGMKQRVEIMKTLYKGADILILDEPTAVLTPQEVKELEKVLFRLKEKGKTIILITHKLPEIMAMANNVTILRGGRSVGAFRKSEISEDQLAAFMVGKEMKVVKRTERCLLSEEIVALKGIGYKTALSDISFSIHAGEIFGIAGVEGNGQLELEELVLGLSLPTDGALMIKGQDVTGWNVNKRKRLGIGYVPSDRLKRAAIASFSLLENLLLGYYNDPAYSSRGVMNHRKIQERAEGLIKDYDVKTTGLDKTFGELSGGNQQKAVLGREIGGEPAFLVIAQPTRGLDVGAVNSIRELLFKMRDQGKAILLISAELDEVMELSDRIGVLYKGKMVTVGDTQQYTREQLGLYMAGGC